MKIEKLTIDKYDEIVSIWKKNGLSVDSSDSKDNVMRMIKRNPELCLIGLVENKVIGVVMGGFDGRRGFVHHLAVHPEFQRRGYGSLLMQELIRRFSIQKVHKVHLFIEKRNESVIQFYKHLGWDLRNDLVMMSYIPNNQLYKRSLE